MPPHRIRLRKPWRQERTAAGLLWSRKFGRPGGLGPGQTVCVRIEGMPLAGSVALNGELLGRLPGPLASGQYDVTKRLHARNELQILLENMASPDPALAAPPCEASIEIRADDENYTNRETGERA
jgi:hypothetical protein